MAITTFVANTVLTAAQLNDSFTTAAGLQFIKTQTIGSAVSSVTVTGAFSTTYDNYKIIISGGAASATNTLNMTLGSTVAGYGRYQIYSTYNSAVILGDNDNFTSAFMVVGGGATNGLTGVVDVLNPFSSSATSVYASMQQLISSGTIRTTFGAILNSTSYTAFTLTPSTGTITGGTISIYGYAK